MPERAWQMLKRSLLCALPVALLAGVAGQPLALLSVPVALGLGAWAASRAGFRLVLCGALLGTCLVSGVVTGQPSLARTLFLQLLALACIGIAVGFSEAHARHPNATADTPATRQGPPWLDWAAWVLVTLYLLTNWALTSYAYSSAGDRFMPQDTAYFEQCLWGLTSGNNFLMGSSQQWWIYDPPLTSHFAMHFSPLLLGVAGLYALWPSYHALHLVQCVAVSAAAWPLYRWVAARDRVAALAWLVAYLCSAAVLAQTWLSFHELILAVPCVAWAAYFWLEGRLRALLLALVGAMLAREDLALLTIMAGVSLWLPSHRALARNPSNRLRWGLGLVGVGLVWFVGTGAIMRAFGASGSQVILALFRTFGDTPLEILTSMLRHPDQVLRLMLEGHRTQYLLELLRPGGFAAVVNPLTLWALPATAINLLVRGAGTAWLDVHYSAYLPPILALASVAVWERWIPWLAARVHTPPGPLRRTIACCMLPLALAGLPDVTVPRLDGWRGRPDGAEALEMVAKIPPNVSVAAPRALVHLLAKRERLYIVNRWVAYAIYDPEYVLVDKIPSATGLRDGTLVSYTAYVSFIASNPRFESIADGQYYQLFRDRLHQAQALPADRIRLLNAEE